MARPIIIIHKGVNEAVLYSLMQAFHSNSWSEIYWITDDERTLAPGATKIPLKDYMASADRFAKIYKHCSSKPPEFELFCFQRWFILAEFMTKNDIPSCLHLDSDVLLYSEAEAISAEMQSFEMVVSDNGSPHCAVINSIEAVKTICDQTTSIFTEQEQNETFRLVEKYNQKGLMNLCDMVVINELCQTRRDRFAIASALNLDIVFDHNIQCDDGFVMRGERKKITWKKGKPYGQTQKEGNFIRLHCLHFQGGSKSVMADYYHQTRG